MDPCCRGFFRRNPAGLLPQFRLPGTTFRQRDRRHRTESMNHVITEQQRNAQPCFFHRNLLQSVRRGRIPYAIVGTDPAGPQIFLMIILLCSAHQPPEFRLGNTAVKHHVKQFFKADVKCTHKGRTALLQLSDLFLQSHFGEQIPYSRFVISFHDHK